MGGGRLTHTYTVNPKNYKRWNRKKLINTLKKFVGLVYTGKHKQELIGQIVKYYVYRKEKHNDIFYLNRYTEFISDVHFTVASVEGILARRKAGWDIYAYLLDHYNDGIFNNTNIPEGLRGAVHASEFPYMSGLELIGKIDFDEKEQVIADVFRQSFTEFARNGAPRNQHVSWLDVGKDPRLRYLRITPEPEMRSGFYNHPSW
ncbi:hypothetical protein OESDEN_20710 [Oesophagostomum dentatum]|uniref:Carboxylesterase type B domain-containing protein n=1 Tax=Oesophagostomum dentatum TaxID=61180 RepID=A0A0B1S2U7_OESDE|nr:hypothetical protein OESDEN_20710 [Oesophagostomum dentatum]